MGKPICAYTTPHIADANLRRFSEIVQFLPIKARKGLLSICQARFQIGDGSNVDKSILEAASCDSYGLTNSAFFGLDDFVYMSEMATESNIYRSYIHMILRCETYSCPSGFEDILKQRILKEVQSAHRRRQPTGLNYESLDAEIPFPKKYSPLFRPVSPHWIASAQAYVRRIGDKLCRLGVLYPKVQRRKNMSRETCERLWEKGYRNKEVKEWHGFRTLDLELHKYRTGEEVTGECELRYSWKYNVLQPRAYYCIGGTLYWASRYMKPIAQIFMEALPSTRLERRLDPASLTYDLEDDDYVPIWDMAAFTTNLSELKLFLYYITRYLEDDIRVRQHPLRLIDYADGMSVSPIYEYLDRYNDEVNQESLYYIYRVADIAIVGDSSEPLVQKNSGMLGVPGNIGLSTAEHGFHASYVSKRPDTCVSVGDDAFLLTKEDPVDRVIPHLQIIGDLEPSKVDILLPVHEFEGLQVSKFIKRRFTRSADGLYIDSMPIFPNLAPVFGVTDELHTVNHGEKSDIIMKFCSQLGSFLWSLIGLEMTDADYDFLRRILYVCYRRLQLPPAGRLPGIRHDAFADHVPICIPPIDFDYQCNDWAEVLWESTSQVTFELPLESGLLPIPEYYAVGQEFNATQMPILNVMEDLGVIKKKKLLTEILLVDESNRRRFKLFLQGFTQRCFRCCYISAPPEWLHPFLFDDVSPWKRVI